MAVAGLRTERKSARSERMAEGTPFQRAETQVGGGGKKVSATAFRTKKSDYPEMLRAAGYGQGRKTKTGLPNWAFGVGLCFFVGGAYLYTMRAVRGTRPGGAKEELEEAVRRELQGGSENK